MLHTGNDFSPGVIDLLNLLPKMMVMRLGEESSLKYKESDCPDRGEKAQCFLYENWNEFSPWEKGLSSFVFYYVEIQNTTTSISGNRYYRA